MTHQQLEQINRRLGVIEEAVLNKD